MRHSIQSQMVINLIRQEFKGASLGQLKDVADQLMEFPEEAPPAARIGNSHDLKEHPTGLSKMKLRGAA